jgi:hypothetical protein
MAAQEKVNNINVCKTKNKGSGNGTAHFKKCKQLFEYQHLLLLRDI